MKVILLENIEKVGSKGEVVNVKAGFARNYLVPRGHAIYATRGNMKRLDSIQQELQAAEEKEIGKLKELAEKIASVKLTFVRKVDEQGSMFGSVSDNDIVIALKEQDIQIQRSNVQMEHNIKELGEQSLPIRLHKEVVTDLSFVVEAEAQAEVQTAVETEVEPEIEPEADVEEAEIKAEVEAELEPEAETQIEVETEIKAEVEAEPEPEAETQTEVEAEVKAEVEAEPEPEPKVAVKPEAEAETQTE